MALTTVPIAAPMSIGLTVVSLKRTPEDRWITTAEATLDKGEAHTATAEARTPRKAQRRATALALKQILPKKFLAELR